MSNQIADTIYNQLGGNKFVVMTGARNHVALESGLQFDLPKYPGVKINRVIIMLNAMDTYDVEFGRLSRKKDKDYGVMMPHYDALSTFEDVYAEDLQRLFTDTTGLATRI